MSSLISSSLEANAKASCAIVEIALKDVPDVTPRFTPAFKRVKISEEMPSLSVIATLSASHFEEDIIYEYNEKKTSLADRSVFALNRGNGEVKLSNGGLDYEKKTSYDLYFVSKNERLTSLVSNEFHLRVELIDINDNAPKFKTNDSTYQFTINENSAPGTQVGKVSADDADGTLANNNVKYSILNENLRTVFSINELTGEISTRVSLDREKKSIYNLTICAKDNANSASSNIHETCIVAVVKVLNVNDDVPRFERTNYIVQISANTSIGFTLFQFSASDIDKTPVSYEYNSKTPASVRNIFSLDKRRTWI